MIFLDANIIVRFLAMDDAGKAARCEHLFNRVAHHHERLATNVLVVAEVVWVLTGEYGLAKERVVDALERLLSLDALVIEDKEDLLSALALYRTKPIDFIDAYNVLWMQTRRFRQLYSYDRDFDLIAGLQRVEP